MNTYVCLLERDHWCSLNALWAIMTRRDLVPDNVLVLHRGPYPKSFEDNVRWLISTYGVDATLTFKEITTFELARRDIANFLSPGASGKRILDISGGSPESVAGIMMDGLNGDFEHVFYLSSEIPMHSPYPVLDQTKLRLKDLLED